MPPKLKLEGMVFGRLTVVEERGLNKHRQVVWLCRCECLSETIVVGSNLVRGNSSSCGCLRAEKIALAITTHGLTKGGDYPSGYWTWLRMRERCLNKKDPAYKHYGGRGIKVCQRWRESFVTFTKDMGEKPEGLSIDRINNDGDYEPDNCRWATSKVQNNNKRNNRKIIIYGVSYTVKQASEVFEIPYINLWMRLRYGWEPHDAVFRP